MNDTSLRRKLLTVFFAAVLAFGLVPSAALAEGTGQDVSSSGEEAAASDSNGEETESGTETAEDDGAQSDDVQTGTDASSSDAESAAQEDSSSVNTLSATGEDDEISLASSSDANPDTSSWTVVTTQSQLQAAVDSTSDDSYIKLGGNIQLSTELVMEGSSGAGAHLHLDLNGYSLSRSLSSSSSDGSVIDMEQDAYLWIYDTSEAQTGKITGGWEYYNGGGINADKGNRVYLYSGAITNNTAMGSHGWFAWGGGGVYLGSGSIMYMYGGTISNNEVTNCYGGAGVYCDTDSQFYLYGGTISGNKTTIKTGDRDLGGAGVYVSKATFNMSGGTIKDNTASCNGGGLLLYNATATITGGTFSNNGAVGYIHHEWGTLFYTQGGGAIFSMGTSSNLSISNTTFEGNYCSNTEAASASSYPMGGAIYQYAGSLTIDNCTFNGNNSPYAGAIYSQGATITNSKFTNNEATRYYAGAVYDYKGSTFTNVTFTGNKATTYGGALCIDRETATLTDVTISNNTAGTFGGGIYTGSSDSYYPNTCIIESATITNNTSGSSGSGIYGLDSLTVKNITVTGNTCTDTSTKPAGAFCVAYPTFNVQSDSVINISGNTGGDYVRNTDSGDTSDSTCAKFNNAYPSTASVNIALTLSPGETYQKLINMGNASQYSWFSVSDTSSYYMVVESEFWIWVLNTNQTGTGVVIEEAKVSNSNGTVVATAYESTFENGNTWNIAGIFSESDLANLTVEVTSITTSYGSSSTSGTATRKTDTYSAQSFTSGSNTYTCTASSSGGATSGTASASVIISIPAADSALGIFSWGGALRLDSAATTDETTGETTYSTDTANLRQGYCFNLPSGATVDEFGWYYGTTSGSLTGSLTGTNSRKAGSLTTDPEGATGTVANIVFTNIPLTHYSDEIYTQMYVTYTASDGSVVTIKGDEVGYSVNDVVTAILAENSGASETETAYATALKEAYTAANKTTESDATTEQEG